MSTAPDNLALALGGARKFADLLEAYLVPTATPLDWPLALEMMAQVHAHLDWAREIIATRKRKARRKS